MLRFGIIGMVALALAGCVDDGADDGFGGEAAALTAPETAGVLRFLNSEAADEPTLDIAAGLDARAARNIVAHVRGGDGALGNGDDDPIDTLEELDAIAYVGPAAIAKLLVYVRSIGGVPDLEVEGVLLTAAEAEAMVAAANGATLWELDRVAGIDSRAARNLVERRPHADVYAVAAVGYVGASALEKLRVFAAGWYAPDPVCDPQLQAGMRACVEARLAADAALTIAQAAAACDDQASPACAAALAAELAPLCRATADCGGAPLQCRGFANDGSSVLGMCVDTSPRPGEGAECHPEACNAGLVCAGITNGWDGMCVPDWMAGTFTTEVPVAVSATAGATVASPVVVLGQASVPVDIEVTMDGAGIDGRYVRLVLRDPNGDEALLWYGGGARLPGRMTVVGGISRDDAVNGRWSLVVTTLTGAPQAGVLRGWSLHLTSRWD